jgi:hypothetical protein
VNSSCALHAPANQVVELATSEPTSVRPPQEKVAWVEVSFTFRVPPARAAVSRMIAGGQRVLAAVQTRYQDGPETPVPPTLSRTLPENSASGRRRHRPSRRRLRHPHHPGPARPQGRRHDDDLHARPQPRPRRRPQPPRSLTGVAVRVVKSTASSDAIRHGRRRRIAGGGQSDEKGEAIFATSAIERGFAPLAPGVR